jgi:Cu/Ag efflux protein CusF
MPILIAAVSPPRPSCDKHRRRMVLFPLRPLLLGIASIVLTACVSPNPAVNDQPGSVAPLGVDLGSSSSQSPTRRTAVPPDEGHERTTDVAGGLQMAHEGHNEAHATGTVNTADPGQHKLNISHNPIPEIGWPAMTMDFPVAPSVDLQSVKPGMRVNFVIEQGQGGMYQIRSLAPAGAAR